MTSPMSTQLNHKVIRRRGTGAAGRRPLSLPHQIVMDSIFRHHRRDLPIVDNTIISCRETIRLQVIDPCLKQTFAIVRQDSGIGGLEDHVLGKELEKDFFAHGQAIALRGKDFVPQ